MPGELEPTGWEEFGVQLERTALAWNRVALAMATNGALVLRIGLTEDLPLLSIGGIVVVVSGIGVWCCVLRRYSLVAGTTPLHLFRATPAVTRALAGWVVLASLSLTFLLSHR